MLEPLTITWERLDYRLSWHLWGVLQALHYSHLGASRQGLLHSSYAAQLESAGLWHLAVFILMHIPDHMYVQLILSEKVMFMALIFTDVSPLQPAGASCEGHADPALPPAGDRRVDPP